MTTLRSVKPDECVAFVEDDFNDISTRKKIATVAETGLHIQLDNLDDNLNTAPDISLVEDSEVGDEIMTKTNMQGKCPLCTRGVTTSTFGSNSTMKELMEKICKENDELINRNTLQSQKIGELTNEVSQLKLIIKDSPAPRKELEDEVKRLTEAYKEADTDRKINGGELESARMQVRALQEELRRTKKQISDFQRKREMESGKSVSYNYHNSPGGTSNLQTDEVRTVEVT